jgi:hypothetical protein
MCNDASSGLYCDGTTCTADSDCASVTCMNGKCASCSNGVAGKNCDG